MTVSAEVAAGLAVSGLPPEAQACLGALAEGEGARSFLSLYGDSASQPNLWVAPLDHFPTRAEWPGGTGPTGQPTSALGFLQFERATYAECTAATGLAGIDPQSQIANGWWLAQHDYARRSGGDLLSALRANMLGPVASALIPTWPGGANAGFPARYTAFLATLPTSTLPPDPPPPVPTPVPVPSTPYIVPISGGTLSIADPTICSATMSLGPTAVIEPVAVGETTVTYSVTWKVVVKAVLTAGPD